MDNEMQSNAGYILIEAIKSLLLLIMAAFLFFNSYFGLILLSPYVLFLVYRIARKAGERQRRLLIRYFKDMLSCMLTALEAGYSVERSMASVRNDMSIMHGEKCYMVKEIVAMEARLDIGENIEDIFRDFAEKTRIKEIEYFADVFSVAKRSGGDIISLIRAANKDLYEKLELRREIESIISSIVTQSTIMKLMPLLILLYMRLFSGSFLDPLYRTAIGRLVMIVVAILYFVLAEYIERLTASAGN